MDSLACIAPWVLGSVCIGLAVGFFVGRGRSGHAESRRLAELERKATLNVLVGLLESAEQMTSDVKTHDSEIRETALHIGNVRVSEEMEGVKRTVLGHVANLLTSNKRLQEDLVCARYHMEEQAQEIDEARRDARTDAVTGVSNRKAVDEKLHLLHAAWRREGQAFVLILLDMDHFKRINDSHGHPAGDRVLEKLGEWLKQWIREGDFVGRYGGDEFAVLLPQTELDAGLELAQGICDRTADATSRIAVGSEQVSISVSIGVSAPQEGDTPDSVLNRADEALYKSKHRGRNQVNCQQPQQEAVLAEA